MFFIKANSTFAWYATQANIVKSGASVEHLKTAASDLATGNYYIVPTITDNNATNGLALSDKTGATWAIVGGKLQAATGTTEGTITVGIKVYATRTGEGTELSPYAYSNEITSGDAKLKSIAGDYVFTITASGRARVKNAAGSYNVGYESTATGTFSINASTGAYSIDVSTFYYSVGGFADDSKTGTAGADPVTTDTPVDSVAAGLTLTW